MNYYREHENMQAFLISRFMTFFDVVVVYKKKEHLENLLLSHSKSLCWLLQSQLMDDKGSCYLSDQSLKKTLLLFFCLLFHVKPQRNYILLYNIHPQTCKGVKNLMLNNKFMPLKWTHRTIKCFTAPRIF